MPDSAAQTVVLRVGPRARAVIPESLSRDRALHGRHTQVRHTVQTPKLKLSAKIRWTVCEGREK